MTRPGDREGREDWRSVLRDAVWGRWWSALALIVLAMLLIPFVARFY